MLIIGYERFCSSLAGRFSFDRVSIYSTIGVLERENNIFYYFNFFYFIVLLFSVFQHLKFCD